MVTSAKVEEGAGRSVVKVVIEVLLDPAEFGDGRSQ